MYIEHKHEREKEIKLQTELIKLNIKWNFLKRVWLSSSQKNKSHIVDKYHNPVFNDYVDVFLVDNEWSDLIGFVFDLIPIWVWYGVAFVSPLEILL